MPPFINDLEFVLEEEEEMDAEEVEAPRAPSPYREERDEIRRQPLEECLIILARELPNDAPRLMLEAAIDYFAMRITLEDLLCEYVEILWNYHHLFPQVNRIMVDHGRFSSASEGILFLAYRGGVYHWRTPQQYQQLI